jgi:hypothetical protein
VRSPKSYNNIYYSEFVANYIMKKFFQLKRLPSTDLRKYSRLGLASYVLVIVTALIIIGDLTLFLRFSNTLVTEYFKGIDLVATLLAAGVALAGIILGFAAVVQKQKKRLFGIIGLIFNSLFLLTIFTLYISNAVAFWRLAGK